MPRDLPDCDKCDASESLQAIRSDTNGLIWAYCTCCGKTMLVNAEGRIVAHGT